MVARQNHGFDFENEIISKYSFIKSKNYTSKYDAFTETGVPVQIKCIKFKGSVDFGDFKRNQAHSDPFILIVGFWKYKRNNIVKEFALIIDNEVFSKETSFCQTDEMYNELKSISNLRTDDDIWRKYVRKWKTMYPETNMIKLRFKRDHKRQKRIQCGICYGKFITTFISKFTKL